MSAEADLSFGPAVCRVCLCGESSIPYMGKIGGEPLISPCNCKGTMGLYHKSCLEHWLYISKTTHCELCKFRFQYGTKMQGFCAYVRQKGWNCRNFRSLPADIFTLLIFTPLAVLLVYYCIKTAMEDAKAVNKGESAPGESVAMMGLAFTITVTISFWHVTTFIFHLKQFHLWQQNHKLVFIVDQLEQSRRSQQRSFRRQILNSIIAPFCCCCRESTSSFILPMRDIDLNPQMLSPGVFTSSANSSASSRAEPSSSASSSAAGSSASSSEHFESARSGEFPLSTFRPFEVPHQPLSISGMKSSDRPLFVNQDDPILYDSVPPDDANFSEIDLGSTLSPMLLEVASSPQFLCLKTMGKTDL